MSGATAATPPARKVALVGAGLVGASWAVVFARAGIEVTAHDADTAQLEEAGRFVVRALSALAAAGLLQEPVATVRSRVALEPDLGRALDGADYVQESVGERLELKRQVFETLDRGCGPAAILASSTSTFPTSAFAEALPGCARCIVAHPVNPPHLIPFTEVSGAVFTAPAVVERTMRLMESVGQSPIHVRREIDGFVLNRLQWTLLAEALRLVADGVASAEDVDRAIRDGLGRRWAFMGPMEVGDLNAPAGIADYLTRFGPAISRIATSRGAGPLPLAPGLIEAIAADCGAVRAPATRSARLARRDEQLLALAALLRAAPDSTPRGRP